MQRQHTKHTKWTWLIAGLVGVVVAALVGWLWPHLAVLTDRDRLVELINHTGPWAPLVYMALQCLQVVIAPIPGSIISLVGGYLFGTWLGTLYAVVGSMVGFWVVFWLAKRYGRRLLHVFVGKRQLDRVDNLLGPRAAPLLFITFLLPLVPDPAVGYIAGLSPLSIRTLMLISLVARLPGVLVLNIVAGQAAQQNYLVVVITLVVLAIVLGLMWLFRRQVEVWSRRLFRVDYPGSDDGSARSAR